MMDATLRRRAGQLLSRIERFLPRHGELLDIGCGTGHNAEAIRDAIPRLRVREADVVDMSVVGPPPVLFDGERLPFAAERFDVATLLFVLQYPRDPLALLREAHRVVGMRLIVIQSTQSGGISRRILTAREWAQGRGASAFARRIGFVPQHACPLRPARVMDRRNLRELFREAGWVVRRHAAQAWPLTGVSRDLFVLEKP